jgi:hypothetical protein
MMMSCVASLVFIAGCSTVCIKDDLAATGPKGYVVFDWSRLWPALGPGNGDNRPDLYRITDTGEVLEWRLELGLVDTYEVHLAKVPGIYRYSVRFNCYPPIRKDVTITVKEGMVSPIRIDCDIAKTGYSHREYDIRFFSADPVPTNAWSRDASITWRKIE